MGLWYSNSIVLCINLVWTQLEQKYGASPDHMLPIDKPYDQEIFLSHEEREMIDGVLNEAKVVLGKRRGILGWDFHESDEIAEFLGKVSPTKKPVGSESELDSDNVLTLKSMEEDMITAANDATLKRN